MRSPSRTSRSPAACSSRAATLTASPVTRRWPVVGSPATTSPVFTPVRLASRTPQWRSSSSFELRQCPLHPGRGADRTECVVLVQLREAEDRHHRVADELLDDAAVLLELRAHRVEVARHHLAERLRVELLAHRGGALEVGEDDRDDLAELLRRVRRTRAVRRTRGRTSRCRGCRCRSARRPAWTTSLPAFANASPDRPPDLDLHLTLTDPQPNPPSKGTPNTSQSTNSQETSDGGRAA